MKRTGRWEDLEVEISRAAEGGLEVRILRSPFNRPRAAFAPPFPNGGARRKWQELDSWIQDYLRAKNDATRIPPLNVVSLGQQLFAALFPGPLCSTLALADGLAGEEAALRIRLSFDTSIEAVNEGAVVPWELAWSPFREEFLALDPQTPLVRYIDSIHPRRSMDVAPPLRVLLVAANPDQDLDLEEERRAVLDAVGDSSVLEIEVLAEPTLESLKLRLEDGDFEVLHFMGHGGFDDSGGFLVFESAEGGQHAVTDRVLESVLRAEGTLRLVVLASCEGAQLSRAEDTEGLYGAAARLTRRGLAVVGMQFVISDRAAACFSSAFYRSLMRGELLEEAVTHGRRELFHEDEHSLEWASPILFLGVPEGRLVKIPRYQTSDSLEDQKEERLLGILSMGRTKWSEDTLERVEYSLDLSGFFRSDGEDGRYIRDNALWPVVAREVAGFLPGVVSRSRTNVLEMSAHFSIAYAAGRSLEAMAGSEVVFHQRGLRGLEEWRIDEGEVPGLWTRLEETELDGGGSETALAVTVSQEVTASVSDYLATTDMPIGRLLIAGMKESQLAVESGKHAFQLAEALFQWVRDRMRDNTEGPLHLFLSGPVGFVFFLGRLTRDWGEVQLYEHDRDKRLETEYFPSFRVG